MKYDKKGRRDVVLNILRTQKITNLEQIESQLRELDFTTVQSTISEDVKELGYKKNTKKVYVKTTSTKKNELDEILKRVIFYSNPTFKRTNASKSKIYTLYIYTDENTEQTISELIFLRYKVIIVAIIPGKRCVTIQLKTSKFANELKEKLETYVSPIN